jgi:hypothetical protein
MDELRATHPDLPAVLAVHFDGVPAGEEFWALVSDEDVKVAASRAHVFVVQPWLRAAAQRQQDRPC